jgi:hypothetical protein
MPSRPYPLVLLRSARTTRIVLLWLALLLALAQVVAVRHTYSHTLADGASSSVPVKHPGGLGHCDLCVVAAGIGGAAPPSTALSLPVVEQQSAQVAVQAPVASALPHRPYAIRAPPVIAS